MTRCRKARTYALKYALQYLVLGESTEDPDQAASTTEIPLATPVQNVVPPAATGTPTPTPGMPTPATVPALDL